MASEIEDRIAGNDQGEPPDTLSALKRFTRSKPQIERCELCATPLVPVHQHLLDRRSRQIACCCDACAILFSDQQDGKFLRVPRLTRELHDFSFDDLQWESMMLPINMAFFLLEADRSVRVLYPSPAGAIESQIGIQSWEECVGGHRALLAMEPEVEALIVNRIGGQNTYFIAPLDECYRLVGLIRTRWRGLSGSPEVWGAVAMFFNELRQKAGGRTQGSHA